MGHNMRKADVVQKELFRLPPFSEDESININLSANISDLNIWCSSSKYDNRLHYSK